LIVFVKFLGYFSQVTGKREEKLVLDEGSTISEMLDELVKKYGKKFRDAIGGEGYREALFVVNGERVEKDHTLAHGDEVIISYPLGGGSKR